MEAFLSSILPLSYDISRKKCRSPRNVFIACGVTIVKLRILPGEAAAAAGVTTGSSFGSRVRAA